MTAPYLDVVAAAAGETAPGNDMILVLLAVGAVVATAFAGGAMFMWNRQLHDREDAFARGYDQASHSLFRLATRARSKTSTAAASTVAPPPTAPAIAVLPAAPPGKVPAHGRATVTSITQAPSAGRHAALPYDLEPRTRDMSSRVVSA